MEQMFRRTAQQALEQLDTTTQGLSDAEIAKRRETYGENALAEEKKKSPLVVFLEQFKDLLVIILIAAAVISALSGNGEKHHRYRSGYYPECNFRYSTAF